MKSRGTFLSAILFSILFISCNSTTDPEKLDQSTGYVGLRFDKAATPEGITTVRATLSRTGYQTVSGNMNLKSTSSAELLFKDLPIGTWHLLVEALDENYIVQYKGETDVMVIANATVTASLVLSRITQSVGNIWITVSWDNYYYSTTWTDYSYNPILTGLDNGSPYGPYYGRVIYDEGKFKMWFANSFGGDRYNIGYAESLDGLRWQVINNSVIQPGAQGSWDGYGVHPGAVIKDNNIYKMYFAGQSTANNETYRRIGLATSYDGINWTKSSEQVTNQINILGYTTDIVKVNGVYYLYYGNSSVIGVATSTDGLTWQKSMKNIISASESWEGSRIWSSTVIYENGKFKMLYNSGLFKYFGYAESIDGINFTKRNTPVFSYDNTYKKWPIDIRYPFLRKVGQTYYIYYSTISSGYDCRMGVATASTLF